MTEWLDVLDAFSTPLKTGWVVWVAWGVGQILWYRQQRTPQSRSTRAAALAPKPATEKNPAPGPAAQALMAPGPLAPQTSASQPVVEPPAPPLIDMATFDPSTAIVETFAAGSTDLDSFVADVERRNNHRGRPRPQQSDQPGSASSRGADTPQLPLA